MRRIRAGRMHVIELFDELLGRLRVLILMLIATGGGVGIDIGALSFRLGRQNRHAATLVKVVTVVAAVYEIVLLIALIREMAQELRVLVSNERVLIETTMRERVILVSVEVDICLLLVVLIDVSHFFLRLCERFTLKPNCFYLEYVTLSRFFTSKRNLV